MLSCPSPSIDSQIDVLNCNQESLKEALFKITFFPLRAATHSKLRLSRVYSEQLTTSKGRTSPKEAVGAASFTSYLKEYGVDYLG